jgi:hypothetical protein
MRLDYFSIWGYLSMVLWLAVPVLWTLHAKRRPRRWLGHIALAVAVAALVFAKINSVRYVGRIEIDTSEQMAKWKAEQNAKLKAAEEARSGDVADIRFAEDTAGDYLDRAGMDEADLKYMDKLHEDVPAWKKQKKQRGESATEDDSLNALIGGKSKPKAVAGSGIDQAEGRSPILMQEKDKAMANRLDSLNLKLIRLLIWMGVLFIMVDYLYRVNSYEDAYFPLPVPSNWVRGLVPAEPLVTRSGKPMRSVLEELAWISRRGDCFVYMSDKPGVADAVPERLPRLPGGFLCMDVVRVNEHVDDKFVFEALWYGRSSFVVDSSERSMQLLGTFANYLVERKARRARVSQTAHIIWDLSSPLDEEWQADFARLMKATGMSLVIWPCSNV